MNRKGFTLIELVATIVLLGVLASVSFVSITAVLENTKKNNCLSLIDNIESAAKEYVSDNRYKTTFTNSVSNYTTTITARTLVNGKYISEPITSPYDKSQNISPDNISITITLNQNYTVKDIAVSNTILNQCK